MTRHGLRTVRNIDTADVLATRPQRRRFAAGLLVAACVIGLCAVAPAADTKDAKDSKQPADKAKDAKDAKQPAAKAKDAKEPAAKAKDSEEAAAKPAVYHVKKEPFRVMLTLDGYFEAQTMSEITLRPQEWVGLSVLKAVEHGAAVRQGDLLVALDTEKIDRAISDLRIEIQLADLAIKQSEQQLAVVEKSAPLDMEANQRAQRAAEEDWKQYLDVDKPLTTKLTDFQLKMAQEILEYQEEEYRQLEKMYKANDLTEETERIVLRRAKNAVERAKVNLEYATVVHDEARRFLLPRQEDRLREGTQRTVIDSNRAELALPLTIGKHRTENEKLKVQRAQSEDKLNKLLADRAAMTVKSPVNGVVYYGKCVRGKWSSPGTSSDPLHRGATIMPNEVFMTVVQPRPLGVRANVPESQVENVYVGLQSLVEPTGYRNLKLAAVVRSVSGIPLGSGGFDAQFTLVAGGGLPDYIVPGMTCEVKALPWIKAAAVTVPPKALFTEELDLSKQYVYLLGKNDKPEKRPVAVGKRNDKQVDILQGLAEGDRILLEKPKE